LGNVVITEEDEWSRIESEITRRTAQEPSMTTLRQAAQQALECIERLNAHGWILADYEDEVYAAITALREALAQDKLRGLENLLEESIKALRTALEKPEQEPVAYYHPRSGFYWAKPTSIFAPTVVDVPPMPLYAAAERNNG
jgi:hypothetical protein